LTCSRFCLFLVILLGLGCALGVTPARALQVAPAASAPAAENAPLRADDTEHEAGDDVYRHSSSVRMIASWMHMDKEAAARLFEYLNFALLAGAILFALLKYLPKTFQANRANIQHRLVEARTATEQARDRLAAVEQRLSHLDEEIAHIAEQAEKDSAADEARIKASIETERQHIIEAVSRDIAAMSSAAQRDLKRFAAGLAVDRAAQRVSLTEDDDRALVTEFAQTLGQQARNGGKH
jgi:F-type H+-transporting ATPase subunit b